MKSLVPLTSAMGFSNLFLDFLADEASARRFFPNCTIDRAACKLEQVVYDRAGIAEVLRAQNRRLGAGAKTLANIDLLASNKETLCVFAGQQAVLFGGPLLVLYKALGAIKSARLYSDQLQRPVIPVFWMAGDDHDFAEVNHTRVLDRTTQPVPIEYAGSPALELPTGEIRFEDGTALEQARKSFRDSLGDTDFTPELYELIDKCYTGEDTFVTAFGKLLLSLLGDYGLVVFSPVDETAKRRAVPFFQTVIDRQDEIHERLAEINEQLVEHGYHLQVEKAEDAAHLFYNRDGRKPVKRSGAGFAVGEQTFTREELKRLIDSEPGRFSPDVITRPLMQSYLFPAVSQKGGPSEIAYLAQIAGLFELFGLVPPCYRARPTATVVEKRYAALMKEHHIEYGELAGDVEQVINRVMAASFPAGLEKQFGLLRSDIEYHIDKFAGEALKFDPGLERVAQHTHGKIDFVLKGFEGKVFAAHKRQSQQMRDRIYRLYNALYAQRTMQERTLNVAYFLARYGRRFIEYLYDELDSEERLHQLIHLGDPADV